MGNEIHEASVEMVRQLARVAALDLNEERLEQLAEELRPMLRSAWDLHRVELGAATLAVVFRSRTEEGQ